MSEKTMVLYLQDEEYARRLFKFMSGRRQPGLKLERVTDGEEFWQRRANESSASTTGSRNDGDSLVWWVTDDVEGCSYDPIGAEGRILLCDRTDKSRGTVSVCQQAGEMYRELLGLMDVTVSADTEEESPPQGVYALYAPWGEEDSVAAALLSQELGSYGRCIYVNLHSFPHYYVSTSGTSSKSQASFAGSMRGIPKKTKQEQSEWLQANKFSTSQIEGFNSEQIENKKLGELFFRLESDSYDSLVRSAVFPYGSVDRLPGVTHYRDLWDIGEDDRGTLFERLLSDCGYSYVVVLFNDIREAVGSLSSYMRFYFLMRKTDETSPKVRWERYLKMEQRESSGSVNYITMPDAWSRWAYDMESSDPGSWLQDEEKKKFTERFWREEA